MLKFGTSGSEAPFLTEKDLHEKEEMEKKQVVRSVLLFQNTSSGERKRVEIAGEERISIFELANAIAMVFLTFLL